MPEKKLPYNEEKIKKINESINKYKKNYKHVYLYSNITFNGYNDKTKFINILTDRGINNFELFIEKWNQIKEEILKSDFIDNYKKFFNNIDSSLKQLESIDFDHKSISDYILDLLDSSSDTYNINIQELKEKSFVDFEIIKNKIELINQKLSNNQLKINDIEKDFDNILSDAESKDKYAVTYYHILSAKTLLNEYTKRKLTKKSLDGIGETLKKYISLLLKYLSNIYDKKTNNNYEGRFYELEKIRNNQIIKLGMVDNLKNYFFNTIDKNNIVIFNSFFLSFFEKYIESSKDILEYLSKNVKPNNKNKTKLDKKENTFNEKIENTISILIDENSDLVKELLSATLFSLTKHFDFNNFSLQKDSYFVHDLETAIGPHLKILFNFNNNIFFKELKTIADETGFIDSEKNELIDYENFLKKFKKISRYFDDELYKLNKSFVKQANLSYDNVLNLKDSLESTGFFKNNFLKIFELSEQDSIRFNNFKSILDDLKTSLSKTDNDQQSAVNDSLDIIKKINTEIILKPSYLSYYYLREYLNLIEKNLLNYRALLVENNIVIPSVNIKICAKEKFSTCLKITVTNSGSLKIYSVDFKIDNVDLVIFENGNNKINFNNISGGEKITIEKGLNIQDELKAFEIRGVLSYKLEDYNGSEIFIKKEIEQKLFVQKNKDGIFEIFNRAPETHYLIWNNLNAKDEYFVGREKEIQDLKKDLLENNKLIPGKIVVVYGQTRAGKSLLVTKFRDKIEKNGDIISIFIEDIVELIKKDKSKNSSMKELYKEIVFKFKKKLSLSSDKKLIEYNELLKNEPFYADVDSINFDKNFKYNLDKGFKTFLEQVSFLTKNKLKILVVIDEFTKIYNSLINNEIDKDFVRELINLIHTSSIISLIIIGHEHILNIFKDKKISGTSTSSSSIVHKYVSRDITYLKEESAKKLIKIDIAEKFDKNPDLVEKIYRKTGGSAYLINLFCSKLVSLFNSQSNYVSNYFEEDHFLNVVDSLVKFDLQEGGASSFLEELLTDDFLQKAISENKGLISDDLNIFKSNKNLLTEDYNNVNTKELNLSIIKSIIYNETIKNNSEDKYDLEKLLAILKLRNIVSKEDGNVVIGLYKDYFDNLNKK